MKLERSGGILLHITSLPGKYGIGTLGPEARRFADMLRRAGQDYWQVLPLGPVEGELGYSPYASTSTFAGNWHLISLELLAAEPWFSGTPGEPFPDGPFVDFERMISHKLPLLEQACADFFSFAGDRQVEDYRKFREKESAWLEDFALYSALADHTGTRNWHKWDAALSARKPEELERWRNRLEDRVRFHAFLQYLFMRQWEGFREYCAERHIRIIGDIPIYITLEGADAWSNQEILQLDEKSGKPRFVAGVPPDYFSDTGQLWGNPLYLWEKGSALNNDTFRWWARRIAHLNRLVDLVRIDHFRAFDSYWSIPAEEKTAVRGKWIKGPGLKFFHRLRDELGHLPLIAEDLGVITPEVEELRDELGLPGMRILQFAFDQNNRNYYLPHNIDNPNCILYTGTHDNNTTNGWFYGSEIDEEKRRYVLEYLGLDDWSDFNWKLVRQAYRTVASMVIIPAQDLPGFGAEFRMNTPGTTDGNWRWKLTENAITDDMLLRLRRMGQLYDRIREEG